MIHAVDTPSSPFPDSFGKFLRGHGPIPDDVIRIFRLKHGPEESWGWSPRMRFRSGYFTPDDIYETLVDAMATQGCSWLDVGGGRDPFPTNRPLASQLARRCGRLVGVDPDEAVEQNPYIHERVRLPIDLYFSERPFDLVTLRMVAEHLTDPDSSLASLARAVRPGGWVVVYTVNRWSPAAIASWLTPLNMHHVIKRILWNTAEEDTFPVVYKLNTRRQLDGRFEAHGFRPIGFACLDDCRTFGRFRALLRIELAVWRALSSVGIRYPENCLLGVYERKGERGVDGLEET